MSSEIIDILKRHPRKLEAEAQATKNLTTQIIPNQVQRLRCPTCKKIWSFSNYNSIECCSILYKKGE